ncbi:MAG: maltose 6'-phosphate phosphatase [Cyclobacteriaceae bacterium]|jgi:exonuclease III
MRLLIFSACVLLLFSCTSKSSSKQEDNLLTPVQIRVAAYNVEVSRNATAKEIGLALKAYDLDIACFSEAPGGEWTKEVGAAMGLNHVVVGKYPTAGHDDKYKTIASKTPLYGSEEILMADTLHTVTKAKTKINGKEIGIYSVHFPFGWRDQEHIDETTGKVTAFIDYLKKTDDKEISIVMGDFNFIPTNADKTSDYHEMFVEIGLDVSWKALKIDPTQRNTYNALEPKDEGNGDVIDHVMYSSKQIKVLDGDIIEWEKPLSDHKPIWAVLQLK